MIVRFLYAVLVLFFASLISTQAKAQDPTQFSCVAESRGFATIASRGNKLRTAPLILWTTALGGWSPEKRCQIVTERLNQAVVQNGGQMGGLSLTSGPVNQETVICFVKTIGQSCTDRNMLFTLNSSNAQDPAKIIQQMASFAMRGSGQPIVEKPPEPLVDSTGEIIPIDQPITGYQGSPYFRLSIWEEHSNCKTLKTKPGYCN